MNKFIPAIIVLIFIICAGLVLININENNIYDSDFDPATKPDTEPENFGAVEEYFPINKNTKYTYAIAGKDETYEMTIDYAGENKMQQRTKHINGVEISVIQVKDGIVTRTIYQDEEYFRRNLMNNSDEQEVLLMEPIMIGTEWMTADDGLRKISAVSVEISTQMNVYDAIEVTTEWDNKKSVEYYSKGVGLVKSVIMYQESETISVLSDIQKNSFLTEDVSFYYPDFKEMKILKKTYEVEFRTNDYTEDVLTKAYKDIVYGEESVLTNKSKINIIETDLGGTLHIDLNKEFIRNLKVEALREGMILQSITNTFGRFFEAEQVRLTVDNEDYKSENITLNHRPMEVNYIDYPLFYDVVVYGGTASGIMAAVAAAREGADVALIEQSSHLGGMVSGGLSYTDLGNITVIGGLTKEFFENIGEHYNKKVSWYYEPKVAEKILIEMLKKEGVHVYYNSLLKENDGVEKDLAKIISIEMINGDLFFSRIFIDSTYEGDLMAMSHVSYTFGREGGDEYDERFAGILPPMGMNSFYYNLKAYDEKGDLFEEISLNLPGPSGRGDNKIQAYNYRLCITDDVDNQIPFTKPENYNKDRYKLLGAWLNLIKENKNQNLEFSDIVFFGNIPNDKYDINNFGPISTDYIGGSWEYPEANYEKREEIKNDHKEYIQGMLYFILSDESVPQELREDVKKWGYAADEFVDNDYWPYQLYIREARRMTGDFVMTERDIRKEKTKDDSIGMGSYNIDSHNVHRYLTLDGFVQNEGELQIPVTPYEIPYRVMVPQISEADNLLVTVCVSASHIAYSSMRMEPQYMIMGEAAGIAAAMSIEKNNAVQDVNVSNLRLRLLKNGAILELLDITNEDQN